MKAKSYSCVLITLLLCSSSSFALDGNELLRKLDDTFFPHNYVIDLSLNNYKPDGRTFKYKMNIKGMKDVASILAFVSPKREVGKKILMNENNLWFHTPNTPHPVKLSKKDSFMGSTFSNNDLMDSSLADDYNATLEGSELIQETDCYVLSAKSKPGIKTTYDRIKAWITKKGIIALKFEYYTRSGRLLKIMTLSDIKLLAGRNRPSRLSLVSMIDKDARSEMIIDRLKEDNSLKTSMFSMKALSR